MVIVFKERLSNPVLHSYRYYLWNPYGVCLCMFFSIAFFPASPVTCASVSPRSQDNTRIAGRSGECRADSTHEAESQYVHEENQDYIFTQ